MDSPREPVRYPMQRTREDAPGLSRVDWARELNAQQLAAVAAPDGPVLVLAGAGSGKTRVITYRVAWLIGERGVRPHNILLATFTNKAARAMLSRVEEVAGAAARDVTGGTFHHIANLQLRRFARVLGYDSNFTILDESDAQAVMKLCRSEAGVDTTERAFPSARLLVNVASAMVNTNTDLETLLTRRYYHLLEQREEIARVLSAYGERKRSNNQMDFDDLLVNLHLLLTQHPSVRRELCARFVHVLVDEYQDVNHLQAAIVRELFVGGGQESKQSAVGSRQQEGKTEQQPDWDASDDDLPPIIGDDDSNKAKERDEQQSISRTDSPPPTAYRLPPAASSPPAAYRLPPTPRGLFVVGDDAQSIYSFRGADYENIRGFPQAFPGARVFKLETNYRSVPQILTLANAIMDDADPRFRKELRPVKPPGGERPLLLACEDNDEQAEFVAEQVLRLREHHGIDFRRMAVLYRAHNNRLEVELELTQRGIPFIVRGGLRFFEQAHIKDLLAYVQVLANSKDELAWQRIMGMCRRVGPKTIAGVMQQLRRAAPAEGGPLGKFTRNGVADGAKGQARQSLIELRDFLRTLAEGGAAQPPPDVLRRVLDGRYKHYMELQYENWRQRLDDLEQLVVFSARFNSLEALLAEVGLHGGFSGSEVVAQRETIDPEEGAVTLSTIHQAKGLEWAAVFLIHCQDDVLPHRMALGDSAGEDEERRLLYVAVTRAEELLFMSYPQLVQTRDFQRVINRPSRFLDGLQGQCFDEGVLEWSGPEGGPG